jgi:hypothetical protein
MRTNHRPTRLAYAMSLPHGVCHEYPATSMPPEQGGGTTTGFAGFSTTASPTAASGSIPNPRPELGCTCVKADLADLAQQLAHGPARYRIMGRNWGALVFKKHGALSQKLTVSYGFTKLEL